MDFFQEKRTYGWIVNRKEKIYKISATPHWYRLWENAGVSLGREYDGSLHYNCEP